MSRRRLLTLPVAGALLAALTLAAAAGARPQEATTAAVPQKATATVTLNVWDQEVGAARRPRSSS